MNKLSDLDSFEFPLQLGHVNLSLSDPVQDLLLCPRYLFLNMTQIQVYCLNMVLYQKETIKSSSCYLIPSDQQNVLLRSYFIYLFNESLGLDRDSFVYSMFLHDTDGADTSLTCLTVHLDK